MAPRASKHAKPTPASKTLVLDNGAYAIKAGFSLPSSTPNEEQDCHEIPNCIAKGAHNRVWVGAQLHQCKDFAEMNFRRPVQNGCLVNWEAEKEIWDQTFFNDKSSPVFCDPTETNLLLTEAPNSLPTLQSNCDQMIFEEFEFAAYRRTPGPSLNAYNDIVGAFGDPHPQTSTGSNTVFAAEAVLVIDSGYSSTTVTPLYKGRPIQQAVRRLDVGGKVLTNYLKEVLSVRQLDVRHETHIMNQVKESVCFVSTDFKADMERSRQGLQRTLSKDDREESVVRDYVMPDFTSRMVGEVKEHDPKDRKQMAAFNHVKRENGTTEAVLALGNERFTAPELLFHPENVGMKQAGVVEMIMHSLAGVPTGLWGVMLGNVWLAGGNARLPGFAERL